MKGGMMKLVSALLDQLYNLSLCDILVTGPPFYVGTYQLVLTNGKSSIDMLQSTMMLPIISPGQLRLRSDVL